MSVSPKTSPAAAKVATEPRRIAQFAEQPALFNAQRWFARERAWINDQQLQLCRIPAPTFFEQPRAEWFRDRLNALTWDAKIDKAGNVLATRTADGEAPTLIVSAHLDTVIAPQRIEEVHFSPDGRLVGPGSSDNGAGLAALLALARVLAESPELFAFSVVSFAGRERRGRRRRKPERYALPLQTDGSACQGSRLPGSGRTLYRPHHGASASQPAL